MTDMNNMNEFAVMFICRRTTAFFWRAVIDSQRIHLGIPDGVLSLDALYIPPLDVLDRGQDAIARSLRYLNVFINEHANMYNVLERFRSSLR